MAKNKKYSERKMKKKRLIFYKLKRKEWAKKLVGNNIKSISLHWE